MRHQQNRLMKFFVLTVFCNLLSSGHLQETNSGTDYNLIQQDALQTIHTIHGNFYGQTQSNINPKPCSRRSNSESQPLEQPWNPSFTATLTTPPTNYDSANLKPQALRNEDYNLKPVNTQPFFPNPPTINDKDGKIPDTRKSISVINPTIDSSEEINYGVTTPKYQKIPIDNSKPSVLRTNSLSDPNSKYRFIPSNEFDSGPVNDYLSEPRNAIDTEPSNEYISAPHSVIDSELNNEYRFAPMNQFRSTQRSLQSEPVNESHSDLTISESLKKQNVDSLPPSNKCSNFEKPNNVLGQSRRSMSGYSEDQIDTLRDTLINDKEILQNNNNPYSGNENAISSVLNIDQNLNNVKSKGQSIVKSDIAKPPTNEKSVTRVGRPQFNDARREMLEPTRGIGVTNMGRSGPMLLQSERVCYACSTANNPTCWAPDRRTTVKYCRKGNNACITKTFGSGSTFTLIRDCGRSCDDSDMGGLMPKYKSCSMCHSELCNGAYSINGHSIIFILFLIALIKKYIN